MLVEIPKSSSVMSIKSRGGKRRRRATPLTARQLSSKNTQVRRPFAPRVEVQHEARQVVRCECAEIRIIGLSLKRR